MSYSIAYRRLNILLSDNTIIPFYESGDNNCYDHSGKRSRSWSSSHYFSEGHLSAPRERLEENIDKYLKRKYDHYLEQEGIEKTYDDFLKSSSQYWLSQKVPGNTIKAWRNLYTKSDITFNDLIKEVGSINIQGYRGDEAKMVSVTTEEQLRQEFELMKLDGYKCYLYLHEYSLSRYFLNKKYETREKRSEARALTRMKKIERTCNTWYAVKYNEENTYVVSKRGGSFRHTLESRNAKGFMTKEEAQKFVDEIQKLRISRTFSVAEGIGPRTFLI